MRRESWRHFSSAMPFFLLLRFRLCAWKAQPRCGGVIWPNPALRPQFREVSELLKKMDRLVLRFRNTAPGKTFADTWYATRIVRDLGISAPAQSTPPAP